MMIKRRFISMIPLFIACFTSLFLIGQKSYWFDEAFSIWITQTSGALRILWQYEINMWLYYGLIWVVSHWGTGETFIRSFSAFAAVGTVSVFFLFARSLFTKSVAFVATLLLSVHMMFVYYAQNARGYSLALLLVCLSSYFFVRYYKKRNNVFLGAFVFFGSLAVYSHLFAGFVLLSHLASLFFSHRSAAIKAGVVSFVFILPLLIAPGLHGNTTDWIPPMSLINFAGTFFALSGDFPTAVVLYVLLFVFLFRSFPRNDWRYRYLLIWLILPVVLVSLISLVKTIYQSVYFFVLLPAFLLLASLEILKLKRKGVLLLCLLLIGSVARLFLWYTESPYKWVFSNKKEDWRTASTYLKRHVAPADSVIFYGYYGEEPYRVYGGTNVVNISSDFFEPGGGATLPDPDVAAISSLQSPVVWFVINRSTGEKLGRETQWDMIENSLATHYRLVHTESFYKIVVEQWNYVPEY